MLSGSRQIDSGPHGCLRDNQARLKFASRRSGYQSRPGKIIYDLMLGSGFVGSAKADLLGSDFPWPESEFAAVPLLLSVAPR